MTYLNHSKIKHFLAGCTALASLPVGNAALAADSAPTVLPPLSVTATRSETPTEDVPSVVSVITSQAMDENLVMDIKDLVRFEPGVAVRSNPARFTAALGATGRDGNSGFNIRGLEGNRVLMVVDGVRLPDGFSFGAQTVGRGDYADVSLLKSIEILRGPASALYGSDGIAGVVSLTTKDPEDFLRGDKDTYVQASTSYSTVDNAWAKGVLGATRFGAWSILGSFERRDGHETENQGTNNAANTDRTTAIPQDLKSNAGLAKLVFSPSEQNRIRLTLDHYDSDTDSIVLSAIAKPPLAATGTLALTAEDTLKRNRVTIDQKFEGELGFITEASWAAYYQDSTTVQFSDEDRNTSPDRTRRNTFNNRVWGFSTQLGSYAQTGDISHHFVYGGDVSHTRQSGLRDGTIPPAGESFPTRAFPTTHYTLAGVFVQDQITALDERLMLYPALRFDYYDLKPRNDALPGFTPAPQDDGHFSPKFGAVFKVTDDVRVFANYARGFKAPSPSQVNNSFANPAFFYTSIPNPNLKPETSEGIDAGVRFNNTVVAAEVAGFVTWYDDFIDQAQVSGSFTAASPGVYQYVNLGSAKISGLEGKLRVEFGAGFHFNSAASYARGSSTSGAATAPLNSIEPFKLVAGVGYRDPGNIFGGQFTAVHSAGKSDARVQQTCTTPCFTPPSFIVYDLTAFVNVTPWATVRGGIFNLTDAKYWWWSDARGIAATSTTRDAYTQPGRNFKVSLTLKM